MASIFEPTNEKLFYKSTKTADPRWGELAKRIQNLDSFRQSTGHQTPMQNSTKKMGSRTPHGVVLAGYPDDEGISLNQGRTGAAQAPDTIRQFFYKTAAHPSPDGFLYDIGNGVKGNDLVKFHEALRSQVAEALKLGLRWVGLGGGHDFGYVDGAGFLDAQKVQMQKKLKQQKVTKKKPLILNFDAHLDVRPMDKGASSGTPFFRLMDDEQFVDFDIVQLGVQRHCNSEQHVQWFEERGGHIIWWEDIMYSGSLPQQYVLDILNQHFVSSRPTYISIDIDGFSNAYAMGCSQSWSTGWEPNSFFPLFQILLGIFDVQTLGIYEVSPPLDMDHRTSKLAAQILNQYLQHSLKNLNAVGSFND